MKKIYTFLLLLLAIPMTLMAGDGWPKNYSGVMLQGFYWDSYDHTSWAQLTSKASDLKGYIDLVWIPQSAKTVGSPSMGYDPLYWFSHYDSSFGTEAELRTLISTFKSAGIGTIADVVINHRGNVSNWVDFPKETYKGTTYQLLSTDICADDDDGATKTWADANGYTLSSNKDTGEGWSGMRDLDHNSSNVQANVKAYLNMLLNDFGYAGFRYDMTKGYSGSFTGLYNSNANPTYSVGEYWDGNATTVEAWLNATKVNGVIQSAAFDFPFRYTVRDAINGTTDGTVGSSSDWTKLSNASLAATTAYQQYAVTFVENHDTEYRSSTSPQDPIRKDTLAANAFLLAMPGTPCIFYKHWATYEQELKSMIDARKIAGITNQSSFTNMRSNTKYYANKVSGSKADLIVLVGDDVSAYTPSSSSYTQILSGYHYKYFLGNTAETAWADKASGSYTGSSLSVKLTAVSQTAGAQLVYTTDGSTPTASSKTATSGNSITLPVGTTTLTVGLLINGTVSGIISRTYTVAEPVAFTPYTITVCVNGDQVGWTNYINFWSWGGDDSHAPQNSSWPGDKVTTSKTVNGKTWFYQTYTINSADDYVSFVFSTASGSPQTVDVTKIKTDKYFEISTEQSGTKYQVMDVTPTTGIHAVTKDEPEHTHVYSIDGRLIRENVKTADALNGLPKGIYIVNKKKVIVR